MTMNVERFSLELAAPLSTADGDIETREGFLVRVEAAGTEGVGEAAPLPGWTEPLGACREALEAAREADGEDERLRACVGAPAARHAVSLAYADARSRASSLPLYRWLGAGDPVEAVPVNATVGDAPRGETVAAAEDAVADGFDCLKLKVGARDVPEDVARVRSVREARPDVELRADANGAWSVPEAERALDALSGLVEYVEQPVGATELAALADLRDRARVAVDETLARRTVETVLEAGAADVVVLKPMALGGIGRAREAAVRARRAGVEAVVTTTVDGCVARAGAVHLAASLPDVPACGLATRRLLAEDLASDPFPVEKGRIRLGGKNGNVPLSMLTGYA